MNTDNPFILHEHQIDEKMQRLGLGDLRHAAQLTIQFEAENRIQDEGITDEQEVLNLYSQIKRQYLEYMDYRMKRAQHE